MSPDQQAALKQLQQHLRAVRIDLSAIRAGGGDKAAIELARRELIFVWKLAIEAMQCQTSMLEEKS